MVGLIKKIILLIVVLLTIYGTTIIRKKPYYIIVVNEKLEPSSRIQGYVINDDCGIHDRDSLHFIYPHLTIDERERIKMNDTLLIKKEGLTLWKGTFQ